MTDQHQVPERCPYCNSKALEVEHVAAQGCYPDHAEVLCLICFGSWDWVYETGTLDEVA